jgi:hypothetical protein
MKTKSVTLSAKHVKHVALVALVAAVALAIVWIAVSLHDRRMVEGFAWSGDGGGGGGAASAGQTRKAARYAAIFAPFFTNGSSVTAQTVLDRFLMYFEPSPADLVCDYTDGRTDQACDISVDALSCVDRATNLSAERLGGLGRLPRMLREAGTRGAAGSASTSCVVHILGGSYRLLKTSLAVRLAAVAEQGSSGSGSGSGSGAVRLVLPRSDYATRVVMLMRPVLLGVGTSKLYTVDWAASGTDGPSYDSYSPAASSVAVLRLLPVTDAAVDPRGASLPTLPQVMPSRASPPLAAVTRGALSGAAQQLDPHQVAIVGEPVQLQCYYLAYDGPDARPWAQAQGQQTGAQPAHVATAYAFLAPVVDVAASDAAGQALVAIRRDANQSVVVTVPGLGGVPPVTVPAYDGGVAVATLSYNSLVVASMSAGFTSVRRFALDDAKVLQYTAPPPQAGRAPGALATYDLFAPVGRIRASVAGFTLSGSPTWDGQNTWCQAFQVGAMITMAGAQGWLQLACPAPCTVTQLQLTSVPSWAGRFPLEVELYGSVDDGANWSIITAQGYAQLPPPSTTAEQVYSFDVGPVTATRFKFQVASTRDGGPAVFCKLNLVGSIEGGGAPTSMSPQLASRLSGYDQACVPNLADIAARANCLADAGDGAQSGQLRTVGTALTVSTPLGPGDRLQSANGGFFAVYQADGVLAVVNAVGHAALWVSGAPLQAPSRAGSCTIGAYDGIVRLFAAGSVVPYWTSSAAAAPADQAPFQLLLSDAGALQVVGKFSAEPVWQSSGSSSGLVSMPTCEEARASYAALHSQELALPEHAGMDPWAHYLQFGRTNGWVWPGPACA